MELEATEVVTMDNQQTQQHQTDVESLTGTLLSSSATEIHFSGGSETEFEFEEQINDLMNSQFTTAKNDEVQEWLSSATADETQLVLALVSQPDQDFCNTFENEDIEKIAAILKDVAKNPQFDPSVWTEDDAEQEVPTGDFKTNFINEVKERPVLPLMNCIKMYCNESNKDKSEHLYMKLLQCATQNTEQAENISPEKRKYADINTLKDFQGGYFSEMRLHFTKCPKNKRPLVRTVEKYVSEQIAEAAEANNAVLFTRFAQIPELVKKSNEQNCLNFSPEQIAKYGIVLQKAVHQEIVCRCVDFLKHVGFPLVPDEINDEEKMNLSSNESVFSQGCSSQGSHREETDSCYSQSSQSQRSEVIEEPHSQDGGDAALADAYYAHQHSPGFREFLRAHLEEANSPGSSQQSLSLYGNDSQSSPQLSLPELEPAGVHSQPYMPQAVSELEDYGFVIFDQTMLLPEHDTEGSQSSSGSSQSSYASGEPRRRRRRLE